MNEMLGSLDLAMSSRLDCFYCMYDCFAIG
jgi:hypothetical protein